MADIAQIINVTLLTGGSLAARDNLNIVAIMTSQQTGPLDSANRFRRYVDVASVASDFGTNSEMYDFAVTFFGTQPNAVNAGGQLVAGYWRAASEIVPVSAAKLTGTQLVEATVIDQLQAISDGSLDIDVDGTTVSVAGVDFQTVTDLEGVASLIDTEITGATVEATDDNRIVITSDTTGVTSELTYATDPDSGTFVGSILGLADGSGAELVQGAAEETLDPETKEEALVALKSEVNFYGFCFIAQPTDSEAQDLAAWSQANDVLGYDVFSSPDNLNVETTNPVWSIKLAGQTNYRMLYSKANNRRMAATYMARAHTVNFRAENSALTMQLKELNIPAEAYTQTEITSAQTVGLDVYTTFKNTPAVLTSGANDFVDNRYNILGFVDAVQTDLYNLLKLTGTKIPQTRRGVQQLIDQAEKTTRQFVRAAVFAPGTWSSPDYFGDRETFERNIANNGFYWIAGSLADQAQADREARKSPVLQGAVKNAGAIHSADVIVNFNL